jgi:hypothetical protein
MQQPKKTWRLAGLFALCGLLSANLAQAQSKPTVTMFKNPGCVCCERWASSLKTAGLSVKSVETTHLSAAKDKAGIPAGLRSCHTASVAGYVFEGHVPADLIRKVLKERPQIVGLAAPGMPLGAPGMDAQGTSHPYQVIAFTADGKTSVYAQR